MANVAANHATIIKEQVARIHSATNDGTLDKNTINDALAQLTTLASAELAPVQGSLGKNSEAQNRAVPRPHPGEPGHDPNLHPNQNPNLHPNQNPNPSQPRVDRHGNPV